MSQAENVNATHGPGLLLIVAVLAVMPVSCKTSSNSPAGYPPPATAAQQAEAFKDAKTVRLVIREEYQDNQGMTLPIYHDLCRTAVEAMGITVVEDVKPPVDATLEVEVKGTFTEGRVNLETRPFEPEAWYNEVKTCLKCCLTLKAGQVAATQDVPDSCPGCTSTGGLDPRDQMAQAVRQADLAKSVLALFSAFRPVEKARVLIALLRYDKEDYGTMSVGGVACALDKEGHWHCTPFDRGWQRNLGPYVEALQEMRGDAVEPLCEALRSETAAIRRGAARALGAIGDARAARPLLRAMKDPERSVVAAATEAIGKMRTEQAVTSLVEALKDSKTAWGAAEALGETGDPRAVKPLIEALRTSDGAFMAAQALGKIPDARAVEPLIEALRSDDLMLRYSAAESLGKIKDRRAVPALVAALRDADSSVRLHAAESLGEIGDCESVEGLVAALNDPDGTVKSQVIDALSRIGDPRAVPVLLARMTEDKDLLARQAAAEAAVSLDPKAIEAVVKVLKNADRRLRWEATEWLARLGDAGVLAALEETAGKDADEAVRAGARKAIEQVRNRH